MRNKDSFVNGFLECINSVYNDFIFIKEQDGIYCFGHKVDSYNKPLPTTGGTLDIGFDKDVAFIDVEMVKMIDYENKEMYPVLPLWINDKAYCKGHSAACKLFSILVENGY